MEVESNGQIVSAPNEAVDRSTWLKDVTTCYPQIKDVKERIKPLHRAVSFARFYKPGNPQVKDKLDRTIIIQLIIQHLKTKGYHKSLKSLEAETGIDGFSNGNATSSRLNGLLRGAIRDVDKIWNHAIGGEGQAKGLEIEDHLYELGLLEEGTNQNRNFLTFLDKGDEDINIWMETEDNLVVESEKELLVDNEEEIVKAGSLNKLVERLTSEDKHDLNFVKTFLMTYQSFTAPEVLLKKLIERYNVPLTFKAGAEDRSDIVKKIRLRVCNVLKKWVDDYPNDFDNQLTLQVKGFIQSIMLNGETALASALQKSLSKKEASAHIKSAMLEKAFSEKTPEPNVPKEIFSGQLDFFDLDEEEIARQLTLLEFEIFVNIKPSELLNQSWSKAKLRSRAPNVIKLIERFNSISVWCSITIITEMRLKNRVRAMTKLLKIAKHLRSMNNFNTLTAIIACFNSAHIGRLQWTFASLPPQIQEIFTELNSLMATESAYKVYREALKNSTPPCIPYLGVFLTDLTFMDENPDYITCNGRQLINFSKRKLVYSVISQVQHYQQTFYNLQPVHQIQELLKNFPTLDDQTLYRKSLEREPRKSKLSDLIP